MLSYAIILFIRAVEALDLKEIIYDENQIAKICLKLTLVENSYIVEKNQFQVSNALHLCGFESEPRYL